jgi:hypothetical protein
MTISPCRAVNNQYCQLRSLQIPYHFVVVQRYELCGYSEGNNRLCMYNEKFNIRDAATESKHQQRIVSTRKKQFCGII